MRVFHLINHNLRGGRDRRLALRVIRLNRLGRSLEDSEKWAPIFLVGPPNLIALAAPNAAEDPKRKQEPVPDQNPRPRHQGGSEPQNRIPARDNPTGNPAVSHVPEINLDRRRWLSNTYEILRGQTMTTEIEIVPLEERICAAAMFAQVVVSMEITPGVFGCSEHEACELKILQCARAISEMNPGAMATV